MSRTRVAFIVVGWNNVDILQECIDSILEQTYKDVSIIYIDNDSADNSVEFVGKTYGKKVEILAQEKNHGFAKGNNIGIKHAFQDESVGYIALLNSDARLADDWTECLVNFAGKKPRGAALQTITLDYYDHSTIDSTHIFVAQNGQATQGSWRRPLLEGTDVAPKRVFGCNAAAILYTREFIEAQPFKDLFDETMFMYLEDVDVAARATVMNWDNYVVPGSRAFHMGSASSGKNPGFSLYMTYRNNVGMLVKNLPAGLLLKMFPRLLKADYDTIKHLMVRRQYRATYKLCQGRLAGLYFIPIFMVKRKQLKPSRKIDDKILWRLMRRGF